MNPWERLTRFYEVPGVPLDTNLVEQALIIPVRYLAGSFNYQTADGAMVGDRAMSLIATARANGVEPVAYLTECLRCHEDLKGRPEHYLPWVYRERAEAPEAREARLVQRRDHATLVGRSMCRCRLRNAKRAPSIGSFASTVRAMAAIAFMELHKWTWRVRHTSQ